MSTQRVTDRIAGRSSLLLFLFILVAWLGCAGHASAQENEPAAPPEDKVIYLTFDDGPSDYTQPILDLLAQYDAKATFFVLGRSAERQPALIEAIYAAGHGLGNHTYNHPSLPGASAQRTTDEVTATAAAIGGRDSGCLRPPYGARSATVTKNAAALGYQLVLWNVDPRDWSRPGARAIADRVISRARPDAVVVMHDGGGNRAQTVAALEIILPTLRDQGYRFSAMCRDGIMPPALKQAPPPMPPNSAPILAVADAAVVSAEPPPILGVGEITSPKAGATVSGAVAVAGIVTHPTFRKWQLDLMLADGADTFLAVGESPLATPAEMVQWDTTPFPNGDYRLRLRVVHSDMNYDEYFVPVTIANE